MIFIVPRQRVQEWSFTSSIKRHMVTKTSQKVENIAFQLFEYKNQISFYFKLISILRRTTVFKYRKFTPVGTYFSNSHCEGGYIRGRDYIREVVRQLLITRCENKNKHQQNSGWLVPCCTNQISAKFNLDLNSTVDRIGYGTLTAREQ